VQLVLRQLCDSRPALEVLRQAEGLLQRLRPGRALSTEELRCVRAVEALEYIGGPEAAHLLQELGKGAEEAQLTREARASFSRLESRRVR
jgi:hypothetical protein